jgi:hypothetical protein
MPIVMPSRISPTISSMVTRLSGVTGVLVSAMTVQIRLQIRPI